jgi:hypothetical protein
VVIELHVGVAFPVGKKPVNAQQLTTWGVQKRYNRVNLRVLSSSEAVI